MSQPGAIHEAIICPILFRQDEVLLTYYRSREEWLHWDLKLKILPLAWFYEGSRCGRQSF